VFEDHAVWAPFSSVDNWPCLGEAGAGDDAALITGAETRHITVTAAGTDADGFVAPYTVRATEHMKATIVPEDQDLPAYTGSAVSVFRERVGTAGRHTVGNARFRAVAADGSSITFRFRLVVVIGRDGDVRVERQFDRCTAG
jgi:hypothetical protein